VKLEEAKSEVFDVYLCHNSEDKPAVREIARRLVEQGIKPWLDEEQIRPGTSWQSALAEQVENIRSAAVLVGENGIGPWQNQEIQALLNQFMVRNFPVIPVLLPSATIIPELPWVLRNRHWVDFRATRLDPLKLLIWGITGAKPAELSDVSLSGKLATESLLLLGREGHPSIHLGRFDYPPGRYCAPLADLPEAEHATQLQIFRDRVEQYWVDGVLKASLYGESLISLGKRQAAQLVNAPWRYVLDVPEEPNMPPLEDRDISALYDANGLLLIVGGPGSGKTTTLLELARTLLDRARDDIRERVPVVLNLSTWKKRRRLAEWICSELSEKYRVPAKMGRFWLQHDYLVPLLDGLDEVETLLQSDCVTAINAFINESRPSGLVVCCRLNEYRWLPERLQFNGAIRLEPLTEHEVAQYFTIVGSELSTLREAIKTDPVLRELAQTPLMLGIMSLAFRGAAGSELARQKGDLPEERRKQIFHLYVDKMFQRKDMISLVLPKQKIINSYLGWQKE
jgi:hypothetical protein